MDEDLTLNQKLDIKSVIEDLSYDDGFKRNY